LTTIHTATQLIKLKHQRPIQVETVEAIVWMEQERERRGDWNCIKWGERVHCLVFGLGEEDDEKDVDLAW